MTGNISKYNPDHYIQLSGALFEEVQLSGIFDDSKTFVDSVPKSDPDEILNQYNKEKEKPNFDLKNFIFAHFDIPEDNSSGDFTVSDSMDHHIKKLWEYLSRKPDSGVSPYSTLIPLPSPYIVPGGRFREIYYWDTYFTAEGLAASGRLDMVEHLTSNFAHLVEEIGHVPNGNRLYYVSRSQPPFLVLLIDLLARTKGKEAIEPYLPGLKKEYAFWMDGADRYANKNSSHRRVISFSGGEVLNRYWDDRPLPREESFKEDFELGKELDEVNARKLYCHLRAGAESGWDYSSRWFRDGNSLSAICTTDILPVDLNSLLWFMEAKLGEWTGENEYSEAADKRKDAFNRHFWNDSEGYYFDWNWADNHQTEIWSLAGAYPLFLGMASQQQADAVANIIENKFLKPGGLVTSLHETGQQWDFPNGWAPLQWAGVKGLMNYGHEKLAFTIAERWLRLNEKIFDRTGKMMEKYNVCDLSLEAGGGEYPLQDGFGWTNGITVALKKVLDKF